LAFVAEEKFLGDFDDLDPMLVVGYEGIAGCLLWLILLPIFNLIKCDSQALCHNQDHVIESTLGVFRDYAANPLLIWQSVATILCVTILNISGVSITKYGSAAQRTACDMLRPLFVWIFFLNVNVGSGKEDFSWWQAIGFLVLTIGVFVYNEMIVIPFFGFNIYTKIAIEEREKHEEEVRSLAYQ
jgi:hypothetical protein